jgi:hypothetical protein
MCKEGRMIIPKPLQCCAVLWYHHYLQHPGNTCLEETMNATMYLKGVCTTIQSITKPCKSCQVNKKQRLNYGTKTIVTISWTPLCDDLVGPYTLKGKDCTVIDFTALMMINPASSWIKIVELT